MSKDASVRRVIINTVTQKGVAGDAFKLTEIEPKDSLRTELETRITEFNTAWIKANADRTMEPVAPYLVKNGDQYDVIQEDINRLLNINHTYQAQLEKQTIDKIYFKSDLDTVYVDDNETWSSVEYDKDGKVFKTESTHVTKWTYIFQYTDGSWLIEKSKERF